MVKVSEKNHLSFFSLSLEAVSHFLQIDRSKTPAVNNMITELALTLWKILHYQSTIFLQTKSCMLFSSILNILRV